MGKETYHHGNLKNKLLELAIIKIEELGIEKLSIRDLARDIGISKNAPYRHFKSKDILLEAIADFGFRKLAKMMSDAIDENESCKENIKNIGFKYLNFSREHPNIYKVMFFNNWTSPSCNPIYDQNGKNAFMVLMDQVKTGIEKGELKSKDPVKASMTVWAYIHGCASFYIDKINLPFDIKLEEESFIQTEVLFNGL